MESDDDEGFCAICDLSLTDEESVCLKRKGAAGVNSWAEKKGDCFRVAEGDIVHVKCRKEYTKVNPKQQNCPDSNSLAANTRSLSTSFDFKQNCFLCGRLPTKKELANDIHYASCKNRELDQSILKSISDRNNDSWALEVKGRLESINDLHAEDALYHGSCRTRFRFGNEKDLPDSSTSRKRGRPKGGEKETAFNEIIEFLMGNKDKQVTIRELQSMIVEKVPGTYTINYFFFFCNNILSIYQSLCWLCWMVCSFPRTTP